MRAPGCTPLPPVSPRRAAGGTLVNGPLRQCQPWRDIGEHHAHAGTDAYPLDLGKQWTLEIREKPLIVPLYQLEGNALGTLEEPQLSADVVHLVAQHGYAVGHEMRGGRLNVVDAERQMIEAQFS